MQITEEKGAVESTGDGYVFTQIGDYSKQFPNFTQKENTERFFRW